MSEFYPAPIDVEEDRDSYGSYWVPQITDMIDEISDQEPDPEKDQLAFDNWQERERLAYQQDSGTAERLARAYNFFPNSIATEDISNEKLILLTNREMVLIVEALSKYGIELDECLSRSDSEGRALYGRDAGELNDVFKMLRQHGVKC